MKLKPSLFTKLPTQSVCQKHEAEVVARNIMIILARTGDKFRLLAWDEYLSERVKDGATMAPIEKEFFDSLWQLSAPDNFLSVIAFSPVWAAAAHSFLQENEARQKVIDAVIEERKRQDDKWGTQNHPILDPLLLERNEDRMCEEYEIPTESRAKVMCQTQANRGDLTFMHILVEEISEAASCGQNVTRLRNELIQVAAVAVAMVEALDRNGR